MACKICETDSAMSGSRGRAVVEITAKVSGDTPDWWTPDRLQAGLFEAVDRYLDEIQDVVADSIGDPEEGALATLSVEASPRVAP